MMIDNDQSNLIKLVSEYKKGNINKENATFGISCLSGLDIDIVKHFLNYTKKNNVIALHNIEKNEKFDDIN